MVLLNYKISHLFISFLSTVSILQLPLLAGSETVSDAPAGGVEIPDDGYPGDCVARTFTVSSDSEISDVIFKVDIEHTWRGDLVISLTSPVGTSVELTKDNGGNAQNLSVAFSDAATEAIDADSDDHDLDSFVARSPDDPLSDFATEDPQGDWSVTICDDAGSDVGTYNKAELIVKWKEDSDGDGITDDIDIDDDNDGISDAEESIIDLADFELNGDAEQISLREVRLTPASSSQFGTAMSRHTVDLTKDFTIDAEIYLGNDDGGADGMTFVLHNDSRGSSAVGNGEGSTLGSMANGSTAGIANGLSFEFDTYKSSRGSDDPRADHTQIRDTDFAFDDTGGRVTDTTSLSDLEDGAWHTFHLAWDAEISELSYAIDGTDMPGITDANMAADYFGGSTEIYYGFTAATGGKVNEQKIRNVSSQELRDSDNDGIDNSLDLDSDNDGIADNVEAQTTASFLAPRFPITDANSNGMDDQYESSEGGVDLSLTIDTDGDGVIDYVDSDSDDDLVSDCEEGLKASLTSNKLCPVDSSDVGINGMVSWGMSDDDYTTTSGYVDDPLLDLYDEISDIDEAGYREVGCGPAAVTLSAYQWKTFSFPCQTGANGVAALLEESLGSYGNSANWVMYEQTGSYDAYGNTALRLMAADDTVVAGKGYWIITDADKTAKIKRPLDGIRPTATEAAADFSGLPTSGASFSEVMPYDLPDSDNADPRKVLIGNPFFKKFQLSDMYYFNSTKDATDYVSMSALSSGDPMEPVVYVKDSSDTSRDNYVAITPETPGFGDVVPTMQGFWVKINAGNTSSNKITYPFEK